MTKRTVYLVRHGQYRLYEHEQGELTPIGEQQAEHTAQALCQLPFDNLYCSPILRAFQTGERIARVMPQLTMQQDDALRECIPSIPERYANYFANSHPNLTETHVNLCVDRLELAFQHYFKPSPPTTDTLDLLVCHGNVIRYFVSRVLKLDIDGWATMIINNCGITRILIDADGQVFLVSHNDIGHLPHALRTDN